MSTSRLNVWVTEMGEPCTITNRRWVVAISKCDGGVLDWAGGRYRHRDTDPWTDITQHTPPGSNISGYFFDSIPTLGGHVEIELPPGQYVVRATMHSWFVNGKLFGNWATDRGVVTTCCGGHSCVTLYAPSAMACSVPLFEFVFPLLMRHKVLDPEVGKMAIEAMAAAIHPRDASRFERGEFETLARAFATMGTEKPECQD